MSYHQEGWEIGTMKGEFTTFPLEVEDKLMSRQYRQAAVSRICGRRRLNPLMPTYNFNGGPAAIPLAVLEKTQRDLLDFEGTGISILETSFRSSHYLALHERTVALLQNLYGIPETHRVLLLQGSASQQFAMVPMNFLPAGASADYLLTGLFSRFAYDEARVIGNARVAGSSERNGFSMITDDKELDLDCRAAYVHVTLNNTSEGTEFVNPPDTGSVPLIADMSSNFFSRRIDIENREHTWSA